MACGESQVSRQAGAIHTIARQQFADPPRRMIRQAGQHVGEPGLRIDVVELGAGDEGVEGRCAPAAFLRISEGPVATPQCRGAKLPPAALLDMHRRPSLRKRVSSVQRLRL
jgi:hypothetical protein